MPLNGAMNPSAAKSKKFMLSFIKMVILNLCTLDTKKDNQRNTTPTPKKYTRYYPAITNSILQAWKVLLLMDISSIYLSRLTPKETKDLEMKLKKVKKVSIKISLLSNQKRVNIWGLFMDKMMIMGF